MKVHHLESEVFLEQPLSRPFCVQDGKGGQCCQTVFPRQSQTRLK